MSRTPTLPPTDRAMWRKLVARAHPDTGGDHELFIWSRAAMEAICDGLQTERPQPRPEPPRASQQRGKPSGDEPDRVPYPVDASFAALTRRAYDMADEVSPKYGRLLRLLYGCRPDPGFARQQERGASYRQLAAIGHWCEMTKRERGAWYRIAESVPLADRHAGHILSKLKRGTA